MFTLCAALCLCGGFEPVPDVGDLAALLEVGDPNDFVFPDDDDLVFPDDDDLVFPDDGGDLVFPDDDNHVVADNPVVAGNPFGLRRYGFILFSLSVLLVSAAISSFSLLYMSNSYWDEHLLNSALFELALSACMLVYLLYHVL
ncbi:hypothetical protein [Candidatus Ichthyocystis sparus]|uniref:hypothetical protein n=1 Tax=Candidatus Ichthyocystis sparus TaxID=1561004 RepID=UPI000B888E3B|nr:hypothetical protein [Candidatus Ichthyocystis sparus]